MITPKTTKRPTIIKSILFIAILFFINPILIPAIFKWNFNFNIFTWSMADLASLLIYLLVVLLLSIFKLCYSKSFTRFINDKTDTFIDELERETNRMKKERKADDKKILKIKKLQNLKKELKKDSI